MEQNFNRRIETDLDLNGPHIVISSHPSDATVSDGATQTFSVTASATFPGNTGADDEGTLTYQWYEDDEGEIKKLENETEGVTYSGVTTATLTLTNISSPSENGHKYYCVIDYTPAEKYGEDGKGTGHPIGGTVTSNSATLTVNPYIQILSQPVSVDREYNVNGEITVIAELSDSDYTNDIGYQWYRNGSPISDGRQTTTRIERGTVTTVVREDNEVVTRHNYGYNNTFYNSSAAQTHSVPDTASNVQIKIAGAGGGRGGDDAPWNIGGAGGSGLYGQFNLASAAGSILTFYAGKKGSDGTHSGGGGAGVGGGYPNYGSGGTGGNAGGSGASGGGGGGGGTSAVLQDGTTIIVAGGGGGGGGASNYNYPGQDPGSPVSISYSSGYPKQQFGVHNNGKLIKYGDESGGDANGELYITSGNAQFTSYTQIVGSGSVRLQYNWSDMPGYAGRANDKIYIGNLATLHHPYQRRGSTSATITLPGNAGAKNAGGWQNKGGSTIYSDGGHGGHNAEYADGGAGGGGGAGYVSSPGAGAGTGGAGGGDGVKGGTAGNGGESAYRTTEPGIKDYISGSPWGVHYNSGQGYVNLSYDWYEDETTTETTWKTVETEIENSIAQNIDFSGTKGKTLTVKADYDTVENLYCVVSSPTATNSPVTTNTVQFSSFSNLADKRLYLEQVFWDNGTANAILSTIDLNNGPVELTLDDGSSGSGLNIFTCFYTTEDMYITVELQGGTGLDYVQPAGVALPPGGLVYPGGRGGYGRLDIKTKANREFTVAGLFNGINTPFLYYKEYLVGCVGEGGQGGCLGAGGNGGGMSQSGHGFHGGGPKGGSNGNRRRGDGTYHGGFGTANGGGGAPAGRQTRDGISNDAYTNNPCYGTASSCDFITDIGWIGGHFAKDFANVSLACAAGNTFCDGISFASYGGRTKATSKNNINGRSDSGYRGIDRKIKMRDGTFLNNTATIRRGFADIEGAFMATAGASRSGHVNDGLGGRGGNGALGGEGSAGGKGGGGGSGFLADFAYNKNIGFKEFDGVKFYQRADNGKIDDGGAKVKISLDVDGSY